MNTKGCYKSPRHTPDRFRSQPKGEPLEKLEKKNLENSALEKCYLPALG